MKRSATEVVVGMLKAFVIASQKAIAVSLPVSVLPAPNREEAGRAVLVKVRAFGIITLPAPAVFRTGAQTIMVTLLVGVRAIAVIAVVR
jgi:hypothetical protein